MSMDGTPFRVILGLKLFEPFESFEGVSIEYALALKQFVKTILLETSLIFEHA
jgi:hypothetical protein